MYDIFIILYVEILKSKLDRDLTNTYKDGKN